MYFSIQWQLIKRQKNIIQVQITFLNEEGVCEKHIKFYEEWIGVCTKDIDGVVNIIREHFPNYKVLYKRICEAKKVLPYFSDRLTQNNLDYESEPLYKLYTNACHKDIVRFLKSLDISYFDPDEWLTRIYIDLCTQYETYSFYYNWYNIRNDMKGLVESLEMVPDRKDQPDWTFAAFDLETVPLVGNHIPIGYHESDRIVMISVFKWNKRYGLKKWLLYLLPDGGNICNRPEYEIPFKSESEMLIYFHSLLEDVQVLTGYNINAFDLPCIFARLIWLRLKTLLKHYTSFKVGSDLIVNYNNKIILDLYTYFKTFSGYNLPSFKLDDVARVKLGGDTKLQVKSTGIWSWYRNPLAVQLLDEANVEKCFDVLQPETVSTPNEFGTFTTYLDYCLKDSELVYRLFEKEYVISFLVERANFTALNVIQVLHYGNSRYLLELFKTYGLRLGYFVNPNFLNYESKYESLFKGKTYQGALNFCKPETIYEDVSVMDFVSMYPSALLSSNLCYGTCTIMTREEWLSNETAQKLTCIPYREHSDVDFTDTTTTTSKFSYPTFNPNKDEFAIVINTKSKAFLPEIVKHFIDLRKFHQNKWGQTKDVYHYNVQLGIKILINSLYGIMANKDSCLAYLPIAMTIVTLSRYQLLGSYHYLKNRGYDVCYADTDSLFVHKWPWDQCDEVNAFLNLPHVELKYEQRMKRFLVLSKKRYIYEKLSNNVIVTKGFQKKINGIVEFMTKKILTCVWNSIFEDDETLESDGWIVWVDTILEANYMCRDPKKYSIYRKMKNLNEYKSNTCPSVKFLKKYPDKEKLEHVELTYSRADVAVTEASNWIMDAEDCQYVNYEKLFINQKKIFYTLLNMTYWKQRNPEKLADMVLNNLYWKKFVHAELLHWHATRRHIVMLTEPGVKYTFTLNDHLNSTRKRGRKRKIEI